MSIDYHDDIRPGSYRRPRCPVCLQVVLISPARKLRHHRDSLDIDTCPGSGHPHHIAIVTWHPDGAAAQAERAA